MNLMTMKHECSPAMPDEWSEIDASDHPALDNVRRVDPLHQVDFYRGKDFQGRYIFFLEAEAGLDDLPRAPRLSGIEVEFTSDSQRARLMLTLLDKSDLQIFRVLIKDLMSVTQSLVRGQNRKALSIVLHRLIKWQEMLRNRREQLLSSNALLGLFGELIFLRDFILPRLGAASVHCWRGPFRDEQDFVHERSIFEIKTQLPTSDRFLNISSEVQLDVSVGDIYLCHQIIGPASAGGSQAETLNSLVSDLGRRLQTLGDPTLLDFEMALIESSYVARSEYDEPWLRFVDRNFYQVVDGFPRIVPSMLAVGIERVQYRISVDKCASFKVSEQQVREQVFGRSG